MVSINVADFMAKIAQHLPLSVAWFNADAKVVSGNPAWVQTMGAGRLEQLIGKTPHEYLTPHQADVLREQLFQVLKTGKMQVQKESVCQKTGKTVTAVRYPLPAENGIVTGVLDITFEPAEAPTHAQSECKNVPAEPLLPSGLFHEILDEQRNTFRHRALNFYIAISDLAQFAFVDVQADQLWDALLTLINRAAELLTAQKNGRITLKLDATTETVTLCVHDNGRGMNFEMLDRMLNRESHMSGTGAGIDPGMNRIWTMLEQSRGVLNVETMLAEGTSILLTFPRAPMPEWMATQINLTENSIVVMVDAEESIHKDWSKRLDIYRHLYPDMQLHYFAEGKEAVQFIEGVCPEDVPRLVLLCDEVLWARDLAAMQIIKSDQVENAVIMTRCHVGPVASGKIAKQGVKLLPKHLIPLVPVHFRDPPAK